MISYKRLQAKIKLYFKLINIFFCRIGGYLFRRKARVKKIDAALSGQFQPRAMYLTQPPIDTELYKVMSFSNFERSIYGKYLYFNRVDTYRDIIDDPRDSDLSDIDKKITKNSIFQSDENFSAFDYYQKCRQRSYACCYSTSNVSHIWQYSRGCNSPVLIVFNYALLINFLRECFNNSKLYYEKKCFKNFFDLDYGLVKYGHLKVDSLITNGNLFNPIELVFFKDCAYAKDKEFRICLSTLGIGEFRMPDGSFFDFPESINLQFDFNQANSIGVIKRIEIPKNCDITLPDKLTKLLGGINFVK